VVVLGTDGANVADLLAPVRGAGRYQSIHLYLVAPDRQPVPRFVTWTVVPDLSFAQLDDQLTDPYRRELQAPRDTVRSGQGRRGRGPSVARAGPGSYSARWSARRAG
jgi:hypothetical protein